ncbi:hypothetical protein EV667_1754 [Ancylobacter aquaticus]|uniref:Uncharacterized protein n=1 Tax=Ancylobacter aquaticus TaxID=100 RepID=A0A4R1IBE0_ANCAQ|nr:hypothetical protein [Ancylobacter aquaticus]TCK31643.1 hypothetical protein EV667_1754 [Ancylobacter aquaticus]
MRKPFLLALIALLVVGVGGYFGLAAYVNHVARSQVDAALSTLRGGGAEGSVGEVRYDLFAGRFELHDLSLTGPAQGVLKIGSLVANGVEQRPSDRVFARTVDITDVTIDIPAGLSTPGITRYTAPRVDLAALEFPAQAPVNGSPSQIALDFFRAITAERVDIPASIGTGSTGAGDVLVKNEENNGPIRLEKLANGRFATMTAEPSRLTFSGPPELSGEGSVGHVDIKGFDIAGMLVLFDPEQREASDAFITIHDSVTINDYAVTVGSGTSYRMAVMSMKDVAIRPSAIPLEELRVAGQHLEDVQATEIQPSMPENARLLRLLSGALDEGVRFTSMGIEGLEVAVPGDISVGMGAFTVAGVDGGRIETFSVKKLAIKAPDDIAVEMGSFALGSLRLGTLMSLLADGSEDPQAFARWPVPFFNTLGAITLDNFAASTKDDSPVNIDKFALTWTAEPDALPTRVSATLRMSGPTAMINAGHSAFALVPGQVDRASIAMDFGAAWNEAENSVVVDPAYVEVSDAFSFNGKLTLSAVDDSVFSTQPDEALAGAMEVNLGALDLTVTDAGLYDQKLEAAAKEQGLKAEDIRQLFAGFADLLLAQAVTDRPELGPAVEAFVRFVQKPMGTLALRVTPRHEPLPILLIVEALNSEDPLGLVEELNVETLPSP